MSDHSTLYRWRANEGDEALKTLVLDVRPNKEFKRGHVQSSYSVRVAATGKALLDYSQASYDTKWSQGCW